MIFSCKTPDMGIRSVFPVGGTDLRATFRCKAAGQGEGGQPACGRGRHGGMRVTPGGLRQERRTARTAVYTSRRRVNLA